MGKKNKIKIISHILYSGLGGVSDVCDILGKIDDQINTKTIYIQVGPQLFKKFISKKRQTNYFVKTKRFISFFYFLKILTILVKEKPDLIFLHNYQIIPVILFKFFFKNKLKIIYVDHNPLNFKNFKDYFVCKLFRSNIDYFISLNKDSYNYFKKKISIHSRKISIIPNALNKKFLKKRIYIKRLKQPFVIGMAARINNLKRHDLIIDATQNQILKNYNIKCYFAGNGENIEFLKKKIINRNKFKFFGSLNTNQLKKWYQRLDLYIQATTGEGHSTSILQAMGMNIPILGSNVSGVKNFLRPKKNIGIIFDNNEKSLVRNILVFLRMSELKRYKLIKSQKKYLLSSFTEKKFLFLYKKIINKLIFNENTT